MLKKTFSVYKQKFDDMLSLSLIFSLLTFISIIFGFILLGDSGVSLSFLFLVMPIFVGYKFAVYLYLKVDRLDKTLLLLGLKKYTRSFKTYLSVISKPFVFAFAAFFIAYITLMIPLLATAGILESFSSNDPDELMEVIYSLKYGELAFNMIAMSSFSIFIIVFLNMKSKRNLIPFIIFDHPLSFEKAEEISYKIIGKRRLKYFFQNMAIYSLYIPIIIISIVIGFYMNSSGNFLDEVIFLSVLGGFLFFSALITPIFQIYNYYLYLDEKDNYKDEIKKEVDKVLEELKRLKNLVGVQNEAKEEEKIADENNNDENAKFDKKDDK